jgi:hypothetical protein
MKDWTAFNVKYLAVPFTMLVFGMVIGFGLSESKKKPTKRYPIEVQTHWHVGDHQGYVPMECDSVKGDTIYKDGLIIIEKNLTYIKFK